MWLIGKTKYILIISWLFTLSAIASLPSINLELAWTKSTSVVDGYIVYQGINSQHYTTNFDIGNTNLCNITITDLTVTNWFAVRSYIRGTNDTGPTNILSDFSIEYRYPGVSNYITILMIDNYLHLEMQGDGGKIYSLDSSSDLFNWNSLTSIQANSNSGKVSIDLPITNNFQLFRFRH